MTDQSDSQKDKAIRRAEAMKRKAASSGFDSERDAFLEKARQLMEDYGLTDEDIFGASQKVQSAIGRWHQDWYGPRAIDWQVLISVIGNALGVYVIGDTSFEVGGLPDHEFIEDHGHWPRKRLHYYGTDVAVDTVIELRDSLWTLVLTGASRVIEDLKDAAVAEGYDRGMEAGLSKRLRSSFITGFIGTVHERLEVIHAETVAERKSDPLPVLRDAAKDKADEDFGNDIKTTKRNQKLIGGAVALGQQEGGRADIGQMKVHAEQSAQPSITAGS